ncbi:hypothetical protein C922_04228 [Plasmodium inui San Antonio 1]|uniref:Uncharacterized protein n=1 Tax=Plasmodium inui San Antonio 1 TaxID=1237626 RepID=W7A2A7_9APIC|nr:hypothetical protein C922_04228 [Plasmodium inui San Antonio 1]EUD65488.1 hypothetical protein C922_04228 [Plasmodium inui San Antonio 1]
MSIRSKNLRLKTEREFGRRNRRQDSRKGRKDRNKISSPHGKRGDKEEKENYCLYHPSEETSPSGGYVLGTQQRNDRTKGEHAKNQQNRRMCSDSPAWTDS